VGKDPRRFRLEKNRKDKMMKKGILSIALSLALISTFVAPTVVMASNEATQSASTNQATTIAIKAQDYSTDVAEITFPAGTPGATISNPSNDQSETQTFGDAGTAKPVVTLVSDATYTVYYQITEFSGDVVASEYYLLNDKGAVCADAASVSNAVTFDSITSTSTTIDAGTDNAKDFYLKVVLSSSAGKSGSSTLTILGES
jgi:type II secretory pathway pseudopilin PulG